MFISDGAACYGLSTKNDVHIKVQVQRNVNAHYHPVTEDSKACQEGR